MKTILSAAPYANLQGIQDLSGRPPVFDPEVIPTHLPQVYLYAEKGPTLPQLVIGDSFVSTYGNKTLDTRSAFFNHQSVLANVLQGAGNALMVQRVVPTDAGPKARFLLSIEIVAEQIQPYERNLDGSFKLDVNGQKIPQGTPIAGHIARWVVNDWKVGGVDEPFAEVSVKAGGLVNATAVQSQSYPIMELEASFVGSYGNNLGVRFTAPSTKSANQLNDSVAEAVKAYLYRIQLVSRQDSSLSPTTVETLFGEQSIDFAFKAGAVDTTTDTDISFDQIFLQSYQALDNPGTPAQYGPFSRAHFYKDNFELVSALIASLEAPVNANLPATSIDVTSEFLYYINPFTATDFNGVPYFTYRVQGPADGGLVFSDTTTTYAAGGSDGTMNDTAFDLLVRNELLNFGDGEADLLDAAVYPQSVIYDTGFALDTKLAMLTPIGKRKDMYVVLSTQDVTQPQNTPSEDSSLAISLITAARNFPESEVFGTSVCRAIVIGHSGTLIDSKYKKLLPLTVEFARKSAQFMSSGDGIWRAGLGFDVPPNNQIALFRGVNATFKPAVTRNRDWKNGLVWVQNYDRRSLFWPAVQTVYDDDSSVLNSAINMMIAVELEKVAQRTWRDLTGISNLTTDQFIERSNRLIQDQVRGKFDGRVIIIPETFYTVQDEQRGYSWSCKIHMYAPNMVTVGTYTIVAHRIGDLNQTP